MGADAVGAAGAFEGMDLPPRTYPTFTFEANSNLALPSEPTASFFNVKNTSGTFTLVDGPPAGLPDRISPAGFNRAGEPLYSYYWKSADGRGMYRQSNHWGRMNTSVWSLKGPGGYSASPNEFKMFYGGMPTGYIDYLDMPFNVF
jgi:hypothetical protein